MMNIWCLVSSVFAELLFWNALLVEDSALNLSWGYCAFWDHVLTRNCKMRGMKKTLCRKLNMERWKCCSMCLFSRSKPRIVCECLCFLLENILVLITCKYENTSPVEFCWELVALFVEGFHSIFLSFDPYMHAFRCPNLSLCNHLEAIVSEYWDVIFFKLLILSLV